MKSLFAKFLILTNEIVAVGAIYKKQQA